MNVAHQPSPWSMMPHVGSKSRSRSLSRSILVTVLFAAVLVLSIPLSVWESAARRIHIALNPLSWFVPPQDNVVLHIIPSSVHYEMGLDSWNNILPPSGHLVRVSEDDGSIKTYTVAMLHQLRCIEIIQRAYVNEGSHRTEPLVGHCLNYLRQWLTCKMDMRNEPQGTAFTLNGQEYLCRDWEAVIDEAERNHQAYLSW